MTIKQINQALGQDWFQENPPILPKGQYLAYSDEVDVTVIDMSRVFAARETGEARILFEWMGEGEMPKEVTAAMEIGDDDNVRGHYLDKWVARGCWEFQGT